MFKKEKKSQKAQDKLLEQGIDASDKQFSEQNNNKQNAGVAEKVKQKDYDLQRDRYILDFEKFNQAGLEDKLKKLKKLINALTKEKQGVLFSQIISLEHKSKNQNESANKDESINEDKSKKQDESVIQVDIKNKAAQKVFDIINNKQVKNSNIYISKQDFKNIENIPGFKRFFISFLKNQEQIQRFSQIQFMIKPKEIINEYLNDYENREQNKEYKTFQKLIELNHPQINEILLEIIKMMISNIKYNQYLLEFLKIEKKLENQHESKKQQKNKIQNFNTEFNVIEVIYQHFTNILEFKKTENTKLNCIKLLLEMMQFNIKFQPQPQEKLKDQQESQPQKKQGTNFNSDIDSEEIPQPQQMIQIEETNKQDDPNLQNHQIPEVKQTNTEIHQQNQYQQKQSNSDNTQEDQKDFQEQQIDQIILVGSPGRLLKLLFQESISYQDLDLWGQEDIQIQDSWDQQSIE